MFHEVINNYSNEVKNRIMKSDNLRSSGKACKSMCTLMGSSQKMYGENV